MVHIRVDPILFQWGILILSWHGIALAAGLLMAYLLVVRLGRSQGLEHQVWSELAVWCIPLGLIGARLVHIAESWTEYVAHPERVLAFQEGGMAAFGGVLGGILGIFLFSRIRRISLWSILGVMIFALPVIEIFARFGCLVQGDVYGLPTHSSWGLVYWHPGTSVPRSLLGTPTFPAVNLIQAWCVALLAALFALRRRQVGPRPLLAAGLVGYALGRFLIGFGQPAYTTFLGWKGTQFEAAFLATLVVAWLVADRWILSHWPARSESR